MRNIPALRLGLAGVTAALVLMALPALAQPVEASWSGFATVGVAKSDSDATYQRFITRDGGWKRDSLLAGQLDLQLAPQWSATVQARLAACETRDDSVCARTAWAFLAWRPGNDWLLRAGKLRLPLYLYSESLDVGVASDMARLPHEMYSIAPTNDFSGLSVTRSLGRGAGETTLEAYAGTATATARFWVRDGAPPALPAGPLFHSVHVNVSGLALTSREEHLTWRLGLMHTRTRNADGSPLPVRFPRVDLGQGIGYWKVDDDMPGPDIERVAQIGNLALTAGADWALGEGWRLAGEVVRMRQRDTELGSDSRAGYLALFKRLGAYTPYVSLARQHSSPGLLNWHDRLTTPTLPDFVPGAAQLNAAQRVAGENLYAFDQRSLALGLSYALSPTAKLKGEWMRTRVGRASGHFDVPAGQPDVQGLQVHTWTANLSVAF